MNNIFSRLLLIPFYIIGSVSLIAVILINVLIWVIIDKWIIEQYVEWLEKISYKLYTPKIKP